MAFNGSGGGNPMYGRDGGQGGGPPTPGYPPQQLPYTGAQPRLYYTPAAPAVPPLTTAWPYGARPFAPISAMHPSGAQQFMPPGAQVPITSQRPALSQGQGPQPPMHRDFRSCSLRNSTGGFGCEPGYNYFFPTKHTKIHVLKTGSTPPWQLPPNFAIQFHACHVPVNTTVSELMKGFGAKNNVPKLNVITEVCPGGGGKWYKGIEVSGESFDMLKKPIKELGWDETRTGLRGQKKVVYIYVQKD